LPFGNKTSDFMALFLTFLSLAWLLQDRLAVMPHLHCNNDNIAMNDLIIKSLARYLPNPLS